MLTDLKEKQEKYIQMQKELLELTNQKSQEIYDTVLELLSKDFDTKLFEVIVPLSGGILAEGWEPTVGFNRIGKLQFHEFYHLTKNELVEYYSDIIEWKLFYKVCEEIERKLGVVIKITRS